MDPDGTMGGDDSVAERLQSRVGLGFNAHVDATEPLLNEGVPAFYGIGR